jgi:hypothetical protein
MASIVCMRIFETLRPADFLQTGYLFPNIPHEKNRAVLGVLPSRKSFPVHPMRKANSRTLHLVTATGSPSCPRMASNVHGFYSHYRQNYFHYWTQNQN